MSKFGRGIVVRMGAAHYDVSANGGTYGIAHPDTEQRKANEKAVRGMMHDIGEAMFGKPGKDRNRQRRQRKGYAHA